MIAREIITMSLENITTHDTGLSIFVIFIILLVGIITLISCIVKQHVHCAFYWPCTAPPSRRNRNAIAPMSSVEMGQTEDNIVSTSSNSNISETVYGFEAELNENIPELSDNLSDHSNNSVESNGTCPVCLEPFGEAPEDTIIIPNCLHIHHRRCLNEWFNHQYHNIQENNCPVCRQQPSSIHYVKGQQLAALYNCRTGELVRYPTVY